MVSSVYQLSFSSSLSFSHQSLLLNLMERLSCISNFKVITHNFLKSVEHGIQLIYALLSSLTPSNFNILIRFLLHWNEITLKDNINMINSFIFSFSSFSFTRTRMFSFPTNFSNLSSIFFFIIFFSIYDSHLYN